MSEIEDDVRLTLDENTFDIYIRMKQSQENDFCFQVTDTTTFKDLFKIFTTVPIVWSPSIFYERVPIGFSVSSFPGLLTRTGGILFEGNADDVKYLTRVTDLDERVKDKCLPGQLIIPIFKERTFLHSSVVAFILIWLYTDLPDFISPTPGICLTNYATEVIVYVMREYLDKPAQATKFYNEMYAPTTEIGQCIYFAFHIFKVLLFYFILWAGLFNPYSWKKPSLANLNREDLVRLGWTGVKKSMKQGYQDAYRKMLMKEYGSIMNIYNNGKLLYIRKCIVELGEGEGYDSNNKSNNKDAFILTRDLLLKERKHLSKYLETLPFVQAFQELKNYRQSGPLTPCTELGALTHERFKEIDAEIVQQELDAKSSKKED